jgi:hypothetical protein
MAGQGPAPQQNRQRAGAPARGDWTTLPAEVEKPVLPALPKRRKSEGTWSARSRRAWEAWKRDPATTQFGPADIQSAVDVIYLYEEMARGQVKLAPEIRLRLDGLGLTAKGKRDLRWRVGDAKAAEEGDAGPGGNVVPIGRAVKAV